MENRKKEEDLKVVERFWPEINEEELQDVIGFYPSLGKLKTILYQSTRPLSAGCLFETTEGRFFVKRNSTLIRTRDEWEYEHRFQSKLPNFGLQIPKIIKTKNQESLLEKKGKETTWLYEIQESALGEDLYSSAHTWSPLHKDSHAEEIGKFLGLFHIASWESGFREKRNPRYQVALFEIFTSENMERFCIDLVNQIPDFHEFMDPLEFAKKVSSIYSSFLPKSELAGSVPNLITHGDPHASNFFWKDNTPVSLIDFHLSNQNNFLYDLAVAIDRNTLYWLDLLSGKKGSYNLIHAKKIIENYKTIIADKRKEFLPYLSYLSHALVLHRIEFALSLLNYYWNIEKSKFKAQWCLDVYIFAHGEWFHSNEGKLFLEGIQEKANPS